MRQLESPSLSAGVRDLLAPLVTLFAAASVERELSWYMAQEVVPVKVSTGRWAAAAHAGCDVCECVCAGEILCKRSSSQRTVSWWEQRAACRHPALRQHNARGNKTRKTRPRRASVESWPHCLSVCVCLCVRAAQVARMVPDYVRSLVASVAPHTQQLVNALGIPDRLVQVRAAHVCAAAHGAPAASSTTAPMCTEQLSHIRHHVTPVSLVPLTPRDRVRFCCILSLRTPCCCRRPLPATGRRTTQWTTRGSWLGQPSRGR